ncbi:type 1 fimbrial protein [Pseudomonas plecoglossicida]|uniref:fimbrial protein n=1 Tax=Pseudomonas plecoglossicida TaxID=70775 RepID=UPI0015E483C5|nr:fimbrial protein [Pseudomonas plecoglossicida]MBA1197006.1 type 1 fimbrial protein [Pseudomonas plecoglossicida]
MKVMRLFLSSALMAALTLKAGMTMADCRITSGGAVPRVLNVPLLGGSLTVGRDVPLGTVIYMQKFEAGNAYSVTCDAYSTSVVEYSYASTPLPLSSWAEGSAAGKMYETGVPGIGVYFDRFGVLPDTAQLCYNSPRTCTSPVSNSYTVSFVKIGEVVSSGLIQAAQLPTGTTKISQTSDIEVVQWNLIGSMSIVSRTCATPDVLVPMGTHKADEFSGKNSFTPWVDFSIALNNCPAFHGTVKNSTQAPKWNDVDGSSNLDLRQQNTMSFKLTPLSPPVNSSLGILSLTQSSSGDAPAATGVGVQVATGLGGTLPLDRLSASGITPLALEGGSYNIPLKVRYIQTGDAITGGPANASATFLIEYR